MFVFKKLSNILLQNGIYCLTLKPFVFDSHKKRCSCKFKLFDSLYWSSALKPIVQQIFYIQSNNCRKEALFLVWRECLSVFTWVENGTTKHIPKLFMLYTSTELCHKRKWIWGINRTIKFPQRLIGTRAVSYTHLTLPTICSV